MASKLPNFSRIPILIRNSKLSKLNILHNIIRDTLVTQIQLPNFSMVKNFEMGTSIIQSQLLPVKANYQKSAI